MERFEINLDEVGPVALQEVLDVEALASFAYHNVPAPVVREIIGWYGSQFTAARGNPANVVMADVEADFTTLARSRGAARQAGSRT